MVLAEYLKLLDDFKANGGAFLGIPGNGEPFHPLNRELVLQILQRATELNISATVFTTGESLFYEMTPGKPYEECIQAEPDFSLMDELVRYDIVLLIKCNSLDPDVQDRLVAQRGYTEARKRAMGWLIDKYRLNKRDRLGIVTSLMPENLDEIIKLYEYAETNNLIFDCDTILPRGRGKGFIERDNLRQLTSRQCKDVYRSLDKQSMDSLSCGGTYVGHSCDRVNHHLYVDIEGTVYPCIGCVGQEQSLALGNIRDESLDEIWNKTLRVLLRDDLKDIVVGPCSHCRNFLKTCWSCLGRSIERFENDSDRITVITKGCFNHRPDRFKWTMACDRFTRSRIESIQSALHDAQRAGDDDFRTVIHDHGLDTFWQDTPRDWSMAHLPRSGLLDLNTKPIRKDLNYSDLDFDVQDAWKLVDLEPRYRDRPMPENYDDNASYRQDYAEWWQACIQYDLQSLLPRVMLPSLKLVAEEHDLPMTPLENGFAASDPGLLQFCNLMFFLPHRNRYVYRTVAFNSLDRGVLDLPEHNDFVNKHPDASAEIRRELIVRNRKARMWQRWAEAFPRVTPKGRDAALILPHIKNLSQELEGDRIDSYELILSQQLHENEKTEIDREVRFENHCALSIFSLIDSPIVTQRIATMNEMLSEVAADDSRWKEVCGDISKWAFLNRRREFGPLMEFYRDLAKEGFCERDELAVGEWQDIYGRLLDILATTLLPFVEGEEATWCDGNIRGRLGELDWQEFFELVSGPNRLSNKAAKKMPTCLADAPDRVREILVSRLYNPLLAQFFRLFLRADVPSPTPQEDWFKAVNYFIWLGFFREHLSTQSYFVHHAPNLRRHFQVFAFDAGKLTPSGIILSCNGRLSPDARTWCQDVFSSVMTPLEEFVQAEYVATQVQDQAKKLEETEQVAEARKMSLGHYGHTLKHRLDTLNAFLAEHGTGAIALRSQMLRDLTLILQLNTVDNLDELLTHLPQRKQERFLDIEGKTNTSEFLDLTDRIPQWAGLVAGSRTFHIVDEEHGVCAETECPSELRLVQKAHTARIGLHLSIRDKGARLKEAIYRELLFELLTNAMRYGAYRSKRIPEVDQYIVHVTVQVSTERIRTEEGIAGLLVLANQVQAGRVKEFPMLADVWTRWPEAKKYDGPGMAVSLFRRLGLGDMYYRTENRSGRLLFRVGLQFGGMEID